MCQFDVSWSGRPGTNRPGHIQVFWWRVHAVEQAESCQLEKCAESLDYAAMLRSNISIDELRPGVGTSMPGSSHRTTAPSGRDSKLALPAAANALAAFIVRLPLRTCT